jgi:hypothetical protein
MPNYILSNTASQINTVLSQANTNINRNLFDFGAFSSIAGGDANQNLSYSSFIGGGRFNIILGSHCSILGGLRNANTGNYSLIGGGESNILIDSNYSFIGGGYKNDIKSNSSSIIGGDLNRISGESYSFIAGGSGNYSSGAFSNIFGGLSNQALAPFSNIIGRRSIISGSHSGAMVMSDGQNRDHVSKGEHTLHLDFASGVYVNNVKIEQLGGGGGDIITSKTLYVDSSVGTDTRTSLSQYDMSKPFTTISGAAAASATGDLIYVRAGTYAINSQIDLNNEGSLYFEPGATVNITNNVTGFSFNQATNNFPAANSIRIQGSADFVLTGSAGILTIPASINTFSPPIVAFECNSITGPDAANGTLFNIVNGVLSVDAKTIAMTNTFTASNATVFNITGTGDVAARIPYVYCGRFVNGSGTAFPGNGARAQINADVWTLVTYNATAGMNLRLITTSFRIVNYNHVGVGAALSWTENTTLESHVFRGITWGSLAGQPNITFTSSASTTNKIIRLDQTNIMRYATTNSLSSNRAINVATHGTFASVPATSNITFKIGSFTVDADVNAY